MLSTFRRRDAGQSCRAAAVLALRDRAGDEKPPRALPVAHPVELHVRPGSASLRLPAPQRKAPEEEVREEGIQDADNARNS